jgi:hypothetical protein
VGDHGVQLGDLWGTTGCLGTVPEGDLTDTTRGPPVTLGDSNWTQGDPCSSDCRVPEGDLGRAVGGPRGSSRSPQFPPRSPEGAPKVTFQFSKCTAAVQLDMHPRDKTWGPEYENPLQ